MIKARKYLTRLSLMAVLLTLMVMGLGAFTRLTDAGLGCPDWPGCYGQFRVPDSTQAIKRADQQYPATPLVRHKAWAEMVHRYFAGTLVTLILLIAVCAVVVAAEAGVGYLILALLLFLLSIYQAILGMWTVTWKLLPVIVSQHLLGGMLLLSLLWTIHLKSRRSAILTVSDPALGRLRPLAIIGLVLVFCQIMLGAWTSTNYAALSCPDLPYCKAHVDWHYSFRAAFNLLHPIGVNYAGGVLKSVARMTIQMMHRFGAAIVGSYIFFLCLWVHWKVKQNYMVRKISLITLIVLLVQVSLGIINVILKLPLPIAICHNLVAAILLQCLVTLNYCAFSKKKRVPSYQLNIGKVHD
ncbi:MAG: COX15/CtaA family protein [Gammaproteobacteria bacterium]|nr:COX15/CtaA family protein [Gammaproteobacteria bacterium]